MQTPRAKNNFLDFIEMRSIKTRNVDELRLITLIILNYFEKEKTRLGHFLQHPSLLNIFGNDKNIKYPIFKVFDISPNSASFSNLDNINKILISNDINLFDKQTLMDSFFDFTKTRRNYYPFSPNKIILLSEKTIKNFLTISPNKTNLNFSTDLNPLNNFLKIGESGLGLNAPFFDNLTNIKWMNVSTKNKLLINKVYFDYPHSPIFSSNTECDSLDYDTFETSFDSSTPLLFQGKEELMPLFLTTTY
jgi:hypothetical protein